MTASQQVTRVATARLALLLGAAFATALSAQTQPTFHTEANFVRVDVYATSRGVPVTDLSRDDFELFDGNARQIGHRDAAARRVHVYANEISFCMERGLGLGGERRRECRAEQQHESGCRHACDLP